MKYFATDNFGMMVGRDYNRGGSLWGPPILIAAGWTENPRSKTDLGERRYLHGIEVAMRPWRSWFVWCQHYLGEERGRPIVQHRICGFHQWPVQVLIA